MFSQPIDILLVEDNPDDARLTIRVIKKNELANNILVLTDGEEALDFIYAKNKFEQRPVHALPKVIYLDLKLPKVSGTEVLKELRRAENFKSLPVIIFTSSKEIKDIAECYNLGANSYIVKPVDYDKFSEVVSSTTKYWLHYNESFHI
jgi:CheY-like chemotaxis protein